MRLSKSKPKRKKNCKKPNKIKKDAKKRLFILIFLDFISDYDIMEYVRSNKNESKS